MGKEGRVKHGRPGHDFRYALDGSRLTGHLGWTASVGLEEGLRRTVAWYLQHSDWLTDARDEAYRIYYEKQYSGR